MNEPWSAETELRGIRPWLYHHPRVVGLLVVLVIGSLFAVALLLEGVDPRVVAMTFVPLTAVAWVVGVCWLGVQDRQSRSAALAQARTPERRAGLVSKAWRLAVVLCATSLVSALWRTAMSGARISGLVILGLSALATAWALIAYRRSRVPHQRSLDDFWSE